MYTIMICRKGAGINSLYSFYSEDGKEIKYFEDSVVTSPVIDPVTGLHSVDDSGNPLFSSTTSPALNEVDKKVEELINNGVYKKTDLVVVDVKDYTISADLA